MMNELMIINILNLRNFNERKKLILLNYKNWKMIKLKNWKMIYFYKI